MSATITKAKYESLKNSLKRIRTEGREVAKRGLGVALMAGGGAASGVVRGSQFATIPNTSIPTDVAGGLALTVAGIVMGSDDVGEGIGAFGAGMLAGGLSHEVKQMMDSRGKS